MELDIIFNIDYTSKQAGALYVDMPKYIEHIFVCDMEQFERLIRLLPGETKCYIWVHPSYSADKVVDGFKSKIMSDCVPELKRLKLDFTLITRSTGMLGNGVVDVDLMLDVKETKKSYFARELKTLFAKIVKPMESQQLRKRLSDNLQKDIQEINASNITDFRCFLASHFTPSTFWYSGLLDQHNQKFYETPYWAFSSDVFLFFLKLGDTTSLLLNPETLKVPSIINFDPSSETWSVDISFFSIVSERFENQSESYNDNLAASTILYLTHEAIHKVHNLDCNTVDGIGNFPKIVEEADYQADTIAIIFEFLYKLSISQGDGYSSKSIVTEIKKIIKIAIETTFSFNPLDDDNLIQVRRVNRYLIWFYHYYRITNFQINSCSESDVISMILKQLSVKPIIEITGPAIRSNAGNDRTFFDLDAIIHREEVAVLKFNNEIVRMGPLASLNFQILYEGLKTSNFDVIGDFLDKLFANNRSALQ